MFSRTRLCWFMPGMVAALISAAQPVDARPVIKTRYEYYAVSGMTAASLHQSMIVHGPEVNGDKAYGTIEVSAGQSGSLVRNATACQIRDYNLRLSFTIRLPKVTSKSALRPELQAHWASFERFVRAHEAVHRSIWISCASSVERRVRAIRSGSCEAAQTAATVILNQIWAQCSKRHDAFDAAQRSPLMRQPFIIAANGAPQRLATDGSHVRATRAVRPQR